MNANKKAAAVKKFSPLLSEKSIEEVTELIKADGKGYTEDEVAEIAAALTTEPAEENENENTYFEEWKVEILNKEVTKLKVIRKKVGITEDEAIILNTGIVDGGNTYAHMYFEPGSNTPVGA